MAKIRLLELRFGACGSRVTDRHAAAVVTSDILSINLGFCCAQMPALAVQPDWNS
jgi:hypothetical protein